MLTVIRRSKWKQRRKWRMTKLKEREGGRERKDRLRGHIKKQHEVKQ